MPGPDLEWKGSSPRRLWSRDLGDGFSSIVGDPEAVYAMFRRGDNHVVAALDAGTGDIVWTRELWKDLHGTFRDVGYSNSAIAYRDLLILPIGGKGRGLAAFRRRDLARQPG